MTNKIISLITVFLLLTHGMSNVALSQSSTKYSVLRYNGVETHILKSSGNNIDISMESSVKSLKTRISENKGIAGINASFYNMNNRKPCGLLIINGKIISKNVYNRPYIVVGEKSYISDSNVLVPQIKSAVGGGSYLLKNGRTYITNNHFSSQFVNSRVRRTCIGIDGNGSILMVVIKGASIKQASDIMKKLNCTDAMALDGGTSSQMYYNGKYIVSSNRRVPVILITR